MQQLTDKIGLILCVILFMLICLVYPLINLKRTKRSKQVLMPLFAVAYSAAAYIMISRIEPLIVILTSFLSEQVPFLKELRIEWLFVFSINIILLLGFFAVKGLLCNIFSHWRQKQNLFLGFLIRPFYEYDDSLKAWVLKNSRHQFRRLFSVFYYCTVAVSGLLFLAGYFLSDEASVLSSFFPVFSIIMIGEVKFFLGGRTRAECVRDISGEEDKATSNINYYPMRDIYRRLFGDRVLYEDSKYVHEENICSITEAIDALLDSSDLGLTALGKYFSNRMRHGFVPDINCLNSSSDILQGKSILFSNPFYKDLKPYLFFPMNYMLMNRKKCLIILGRSSMEEDIVKFAKDGLAEITNVPDLWKVSIMSEDNADYDVGILPKCELYNQHLLEANRRFLSEVAYVVIVEPSRLMSTFQMGLRLVTDRLGGKDKSVTYCAIDKNSDGLVDVLSHALKTSLCEVSATNILKGRSSYMFWAADGEFLHHRLFPNIAHYLGLGTELAVAAIKNQVSNVYWYSCSKFPVTDMRWISGQYYQQLCQYMNIPLLQDSLDRYVHFCPSLWNARKRTNSFIIAEDEYCNLFEMLRQFTTRFTNQGFVNVISQNYLLRDYMCDNADLLCSDSKAIPSFVPEYAHTRRNLALKIVMMLSKCRLTEQQAEQEFMHSGIDYENGAFEATLGLLEEYFGISRETGAVSLKEFEELTPDCMGSIKKTFMVLNGCREIDEILKGLENAYYVAEDKEERKNFLGSRLRGQLYQAFIQGQFHTFAGKYYEIYAITKHNGMLLRRAADHIENRYYYRQLRKYTLSSFEPAERIGGEHTVSDIRFETGYSNVLCSTAGYLRLKDFGDIAHAARVEVKGIPDRSYVKKAIMKIELPGSAPEVRRTLAVLLNELFVTVYPGDWEYLAAVTDTCGVEGLNYAFSGPEGECIYIIEDSQLDIGLLASAERNIERYFEIISDYLEWRSEMLARGPGAKRAHTRARLWKETGDTKELFASEAAADYGDYFLFGFEEMPKTLVPDETLEYLKKYGFHENYLKQAREKQSVAARVEHSYDPKRNYAHHCDFCGCELTGVEYETLSDGRERCNNCSRTAVKTLDGMGAIFNEVFANMCAFYQIKIDASIRVRFASAQKIARKLGYTLRKTNGFIPRAVGVAARDKEGYSILIENGAPKLAICGTIAHELTHIWQYLNWNDRTIRRTYGRKAKTAIYEGMAKWAEIQYLMFMNELAYAKRQEICTLMSGGEKYGAGFRRYLEAYPLISGIIAPADRTPFHSEPSRPL